MSLVSSDMRKLPNVLETIIFFPFFFIYWFLQLFQIYKNTIEKSKYYMIQYNK